ncbi:MAG: oligosaccharide flippase family protein [Bacteroidales bacterium]|nr:oligosaccharide flippase family protein [Bacteroidales bacterium]
MKKKFVTNLALLLFLNLLIKPFWVFGIDRTVQNVVGAESYGFYFALFNFSLLLNIILDLGITNFNNRNISRNRQLLGKHFSNIIVLKFLLAIVYLFVSIAAALLWKYELKDFKLILFLVFNQFLISFILYLRSNLSGLHMFKTDSIISVLDRAIMIIICGILLWGNVTDTPFKIEWFVYSQTVAYLLTMFVTFIIVLSKSGFLKLKFDPKFFIAILKQSYPFALLALLMAFYYRIDSVMLERLLPDGKVQAGIYAQAFRVLDAGAMFALLFAGLLLPIFSRMIKLKEKVNQLLQLSFSLIIVPAVILGVSSYFYSDDIIYLLYKSHIPESSKIFGILMPCFIFISTTYIFGTLLTANGNLKALNIMAAIGVVLNIALNLILIPRYFALGSAIACFITQLYAAVTQVIIAKKVFSFGFNLKLLFTAIIFFLGVVLIGLLSKDLPYTWIYSYFVMIILSIIFAFGIRLLSIKDIYQIIKFGD